MATLSPPLSPPTPQSSPPPPAEEAEAARTGETTGKSTTRANDTNEADEADDVNDEDANGSNDADVADDANNANDTNDADEDDGADDADDANDANDANVTQSPHERLRLAPRYDTNDAHANVAYTSGATTQSPLHRSSRFAPKTPPLAQSHHDAVSPDVGIGIAVPPWRSPRITTYQRGSFRQLLHVYSSVQHPASPASSARRQSSRPTAAAARSQLEMNRLESLFDPGLGSDANDSDDERKDDAVSNEDADDVYSEDGSGDSDEDDSDRKSTSTAKTATRGRPRRKSTVAKRKRKARSGCSGSRGTDSDEVSTDATSASTTSGQGVIVPVPAPQECHDDWQAWDEYFKMYCALTHQKIVVEESKKRQWRINWISATKEYQDLVEQDREEEYPIPPEEFDYFQRLYVCTHGGNSRKSRGKKKQRVWQYLRHYVCPFRFVVQVSQRDGSSWGLQVRLSMFEHNHAVSREVFHTYPEERGVRMDTNVQQVETMLNARVKRSKIYDFLLAQGENVIKRDVDNMAIPICFANTHWCCMIVDKTKHVIKIYYSLMDSHTLKVMVILAEKIEELVSEKTSTVQRDQSSVPSDGYSCGFFVCYKIWRQLDAKVSRDLSTTG